MKEILMLAPYYTSPFTTNHYQTKIAKLSSINWSKIPLFLSLAASVNKAVLKAYYAFNVSLCKGPKIPYNFEILPEKKVTQTVEGYCAIIHFFL